MTENFPYTVITADGTFQGRLTDEDVLEVSTSINLEPNYEQTAKFLGEAICQGVHEQPYLAMYSLLDQMRYLTQKDLPAARRVVEHFNTKYQNFERLDPRGMAMEAPDDHLEAEYEARFEVEDDF